jgi:hypothetical protein
MADFDFIFKPGLWIGEGKVTFSASPEIVRFYTKWTVEAEKNKKIVCQQHVEMEGGESNVYNTFVFSRLQSNAFSVELTSELLGCVQGKGLLDDKTIAWEFRGHPEFEGFEVYELQDNGDFMLHAEYSSIDQIRTIIDGRIWKKGSNSK